MLVLLNMSLFCGKHQYKTCFFVKRVLGCRLFFVHTQVLSCPYTRATLDTGPRFTWKKGFPNFYKKSGKIDLTKGHN